MYKKYQFKNSDSSYDHEDLINHRVGVTVGSLYSLILHNQIMVNGTEDYFKNTVTCTYKKHNNKHIITDECQI